jgi:uncharacterized repeat protein (TIGR03803 family)
MSTFQLRRGISANYLRTVNFAIVLAAVVVGQAFSAPTTQAQTFTVLYAFHDNPDGAYPMGDLVRDSKGTMYGTTNGGGYSVGTVFKLDKHGKETVLYRFTQQGQDGYSPFAGVVRDAAGNLYGTTYVGGANGWGVAFKLDTKGQATVLHSLTAGKDGAGPVAPLALDAAGNVYGTTYYGGGGGCDDGNGRGCGVVFKVSPAGKETVLHHFAFSGDGYNPEGGLLWGPNGSLYGTTVTGAHYGIGTVFKIDRRRKESISYQFSGGADGAIPRAGVVRDAAGNLYGTTEAGGKCAFGDCGTIFKVDASGHETVLHSFSGRADGQYPYDRLVLDKSGNLYGTTQNGGDFTCDVIGCGVVFRLRLRDRKFTVLHTFKGKRDGSYPYAGLILDAAGNLYGTAPLGGDPNCAVGHGCGTVFKIKP